MARRSLFHRTLNPAVSFILFLGGDLFFFSQETSRAALPETEIRALANRILQKTGKADCTILVANFTLPSGATSRRSSFEGAYLSAERHEDCRPFPSPDFPRRRAHSRRSFQQRKGHLLAGEAKGPGELTLLREGQSGLSRGIRFSRF
jgi:hypothetical protein